ncbi:hypothetical protein [Pseudomonas defluvii]|uniref:hypothetical protein n=1 Tax=Pseudomonas defluvii TaxID=1876757 RepID=UPI0039063923
MRILSFDEIFSLYLEGLIIERPDCFGVNGFSSFDFVAAGYELVGSEDEFHFYEKMRFVFHHKRYRRVVFKYYFYSSEGSGCGFGFGMKPGFRLKTLLKVYLALGRSQSVKFYFSDDKSDGAVIFDGESWLGLVSKEGEMIMRLLQLKVI